VTGLGVTAIINSGGQAAFIRSDGILFTGAVQVSASTLAVTVDGYPDFSSAFSDGSDYGIGTLSGTVTTGATLTASLTFMTNGNSPITGTWSLTYEALSNTASSTTAISGNYTDGVTGTTISISTTGSMSGQNAANSCTLSGSVSSADSTHNVYEVAYTYAGCTGTYAAVNGVQFSGLATLNSTVSPHHDDDGDFRRGRAVWHRRLAERHLSVMPPFSGKAQGKLAEREGSTPLSMRLIYWALIDSLNIDTNRRYQQSWLAF
jgi:hypothetical protein